MNYWEIVADDRIFDAEINLPASKSISNRALVLKSLCEKYSLNKQITLHHLSDADDTVLMQAALESNKELIYLKNAGTCMRFLTAYFSIIPGSCKILDGDERMRNRPIAGLVNALRTLGADIEYLNSEGFPPLKINGKKLKGGKYIEVDGTESSQYLSALLLIAPFFEESSRFYWNSQIGSASYNLMTLFTLKDLGFEYQLNQNEIEVKPFVNSKSAPFHYTIEADWSSAAFLYEAMAIRKNGRILLKRLKFPSIQGDAILKDWMEKFGVVSVLKDDGVEISFDEELIEQNQHYNCDQYPDLVPAMVALASNFEFPTKFSGLSKLNFKESKRLDELSNLLQKLNMAHLADNESIQLLNKVGDYQNSVLDTAKDHRLVMAYAILAFQFKKVSLNETHWVDKSFPDFWKELSQLGLELQKK